MMRIVNSAKGVRRLVVVLAGVMVVALGSVMVLPVMAANQRAKTGGLTGAAEQTLTQLDDEWSAAAVARDVEKVASFYAADAVAYPPGEPVARGQGAAKKVWATYFADPSFAISWKTEKAEVALSGELGITAGVYEASYKGADGKAVVEKGKYLCSWRLQKDGSWKATHDMWNADAR